MGCASNLLRSSGRGWKVLLAGTSHEKFDGTIGALWRGTNANETAVVSELAKTGATIGLSLWITGLLALASVALTSRRRITDGI